MYTFTYSDPRGPNIYLTQLGLSLIALPKAKLFYTCVICLCKDCLLEAMACKITFLLSLKACMWATLDVSVECGVVESMASSRADALPKHW